MHPASPAKGGSAQPAALGSDAQLLLQPTKAPTQGDSLIAEWEEFRGEPDQTAASFPALCTTVFEIKDAFRRRAFRAALFAEWAATDPLGGIAYLRQEHSSSAGEVLKEWMRLDPAGAITQMLASGEKNVQMLISEMDEIARLAPERLIEVANRAPQSLRNGSTTAQEAFAIFAKKDPDAARAAAESITSPLRANALAGVASAWAEADPTAALGWAQGMPKGATRDAALKAVLVSWAKADPFAALEQVDLIPQSRQQMNGEDVGAEVLGAAARKNWDGTLRWLRENPGKLGTSSIEGLSTAVAQRLNLEPIATLQALQSSELPNVANLLAYSLNSASYEKCDAMWEWINHQPASSFTKSVRGTLLGTIAYKDPVAALAHMEELAESPDNRDLLQQGARGMMNGRGELNGFEDLLAKASPKVRPFLLETGFSYALQNTGGSDPQRWLGRIQELPPEQRANAAGELARNWATNDPEGATTWAISLEDPQQRTQALASAVSAWSSSDQREAANWINSIPAGPNRDAAAVSLIGTIGRFQPETAWTWALSVQTPEQRQQALQAAFAMLQRKDPALALEMVQGANLPPTEATALTGQIRR